MKDMSQIVTQLTGIKVRHFGGGRKISYAVANLAEFFAKLTGVRSLLDEGFGA